jgi:hypothetical protein
LRAHANGIDCLTWFLAPNLLGFFNSYSVNKQGFLEWNFLILWWILLMFSSLQDTHRLFLIHWWILLMFSSLQFLLMFSSLQDTHRFGIKVFTFFYRARNRCLDWFDLRILKSLVTRSPGIVQRQWNCCLYAWFIKDERHENTTDNWIFIVNNKEDLDRSTEALYFIIYSLQGKKEKGK